jgi:hypothetical protein
MERSETKKGRREWELDLDERTGVKREGQADSSSVVLLPLTTPHVKLPTPQPLSHSPQVHFSPGLFSAE